MRTKLCSKCQETKPTGEFWKDASNNTGFFAYCKNCAREQKGQSGEIRSYQKGTSLKQLIEIGKLRVDSRSLTVEDGKLIMDCYIKAFKTGSKFGDLLKQAGIKRGLPSVCQFMTELRKAAADGLTMEQYFMKGRPYKLRYGQKVLAGKKK